MKNKKINQKFQWENDCKLLKDKYDTQCKLLGVSKLTSEQYVEGMSQKERSYLSYLNKSYSRTRNYARLINKFLKKYKPMVVK